MTHKNARRIRKKSRESKYIESIMDILEEEIALAAPASSMNDSSREMDLLVADLLGYLKIEN